MWREEQRQVAQAGELAGDEEARTAPRSSAKALSPSSRAIEQWMWHELPSRSLNLAMKVIDIPSWAAISLAPFL